MNRDWNRYEDEDNGRAAAEYGAPLTLGNLADPDFMAGYRQKVREEQDERERSGE